MDNEVKTEVTEQNQLHIIVQESALPKTKADYILEQFQDYFKIASEWEVKAKGIIVTDESQKTEMEMARVGRLFLREKRIAIEKARKSMKEDVLREGKAIDGIANVLKALIVPIEEYLKEQEDFVKIKEAKEAEAKRIEEEKKAEEERIRQEKITALHNERKSMILPYLQWWDTDIASANLGEYSEEDFKAIATGLKQKKEEYDRKQEEIRIENEKLRIEKEKMELENRKKEEAAQKEKERLEAEIKAKEEQAKKEREEAERKAKEEQERIKAEADQKAREEKEKQDEIIADLKAKAEADKKAAEERERKLQEEDAPPKKEIECPHCHKKFKI